MASMSYCVMENTADDLAASIKKLAKFRTMDDLESRTSSYEFNGAKALARLCAEYLEIFERVEAGTNEPDDY